MDDADDELDLDQRYRPSRLPRVCKTSEQYLDCKTDMNCCGLSLTKRVSTYIHVSETVLLMLCVSETVRRNSLSAIGFDRNAAVFLTCFSAFALALEHRNFAVLLPFLWTIQLCPCSR